MKIISHVLPIYLVIIVLSVFFSCSKKKNDNADGPTGNISIDVGFEIKILHAYSELKAGSADDLTVVILTADSTVVNTYSDAILMPASIELETGEYFVIAHSDVMLPAEFDSPYYYGRSQNFIVDPGETEVVNITCVISNVLVSVVYSEDVTASFTEYSTSVSTENGSLIFNETESRIGFFEVRPLTIQSTLIYTDGGGNPATKVLSGTIDYPEAGKHYELNINASLDNGSSVININLDEETETEIIVIEETSPDDFPYGSLIISEIMANPDSLSDTQGEWFEVYNTTEEDINLENLIITRPSSGSSHTINESVIVPAGGYVALTRSATAVSSPGYIYGSSISLPNGGDVLAINNASGSTIFSVDYGASGFPSDAAGCSLQLSLSHLNPADAINGSNWCISTIEYNTGDKGTPATENSECL